MSKREVDWLKGELPELVDKDIISAESAEKIRNYYGSDTISSSRRTFLTVFSIIGVVLVGLGIILILAHNWEQLSRYNRLVIAVGMLVAAQVLAGVALLFKRDNAAWNEGTATFLMIMVGAANALVGQTYHLVEDTSGFLLSWMMLSLPLIYLMNANTAAVLYLVGVTVWAAEGHFSLLGKQAIWLMLGLVVPYYWRMLSRDRYANRTVIFAWGFILSLYICFGIAFSAYLDMLGMLMYSALFVITYLVGVRWFDDNAQGWLNPYKWLGLFGAIGITFMLTFRSFWFHQGLLLKTYQLKSAEAALACLLLTIVIGLNIWLTRHQRTHHWRFGIVPIVICIGNLLVNYDASGLSATVLVNVYLLIISMTVIIQGVRANSLGVLNTGMLMLAALIAARFLDISFSFIVRGLVFMALGAGLLIANFVMVRRKAGWQHDKS